jgi:hypothetical protein
VDLNPLATELARLSIWVHTFVPGLPLTFLEYNLVSGDSLAGIGTLDEVKEMLNMEQSSLEMFMGRQSIMDQVRNYITRLGDFSDASAEQVQEVRKTRAEIEKSLRQVRARFDILAASRIDDDINFRVVSDTSIENVAFLPEYERAEEVLKSTTPIHFPIAFPEVFNGENSGFDVILGNPPWEEERLDEDNFWRRYIPRLKGKSPGKKSGLVAEISDRRPDLVDAFEQEREEKRKRRLILTSGGFPGMGTGDPDTYKAFSWRFWQLVGDDGYVGVVLPRSAFVGAGSEGFRRELLTDGSITDLTFLLNRSGWVFRDAEHRYTVALLGFSKAARNEDATLPLRGPFPDLGSYKQGLEQGSYEFSTEQALNWNDSASFPVLPANPKSAEVLNKQSSHPQLDYDNESSWRARPREGLHSSSDKKRDDGTRLMYFTDDPPDDYWPVYKGSSFRHWEPSTGDIYAWADPSLMLEYLQQKRKNSYRFAGVRSAFYEMDEEWIKDTDTLPCLRPRIAYRKVSNRTNSRTIIPSLVPPNVFLTDGAPYFLWPRGDAQDMAYLLGILSSIPFDWYSRRFVETNVNLHLINAFPVPRPASNSPLRQTVVVIAGRLAAVDNRYAEWAYEVGVEPGPVGEDERQQMIYELDAVVAHLYGLQRDHLQVIFETFHEGWDYEERLAAVLDYYDSWADRLGPEHTQQTETAETDD